MIFVEGDTKLSYALTDILVGSRRIDRKKDISREHASGSDPNSVLKDNALLDEEFAAHGVKARYTEEFDSSTWKDGFKEYDATIRKIRQEALEKSTA